MTIHGFRLIQIPCLSTLHYISNSSPCMCEGWTKICLSEETNVIVCTDVCSMNNRERTSYGWITMPGKKVAPSLDAFTSPSQSQYGLSKPTAHLFLLLTGPGTVSPEGLLCGSLTVRLTTTLSSFTHPSL